MCGLAAGLQTMTVVALIIAIAVPACNVHSCMAAKNLRIRKNCGKVRGFGCELGLCNNTSNILPKRLKKTIIMKYNQAATVCNTVH